MVGFSYISALHSFTKSSESGLGALRLMIPRCLTIIFWLCHHDWFVLRRLITNSRNSAVTEGFWNHFLKETPQVDRRTKKWIMKKDNEMGNCGSGTLQSAIKFKMPDRRMTLRDPITPWCSPASLCLSFFPCRNFGADIFLIFFQEIKLLLTYLKKEVGEQPSHSKKNGRLYEFLCELKGAELVGKGGGEVCNADRIRTL